MSILINNISINGVYRNGTPCEVYYNGTKVWPEGSVQVDAKTVRVQFANTSYDPTTDLYSYGGYTGWYWTKVSDGIYDFHCTYDYWTQNGQSNNTNSVMYDMRSNTVSGVYPLIQTSLVGEWVDVIDSNFDGVLNATYFFRGFGARLRNVLSIRNTASITNFSGFFSTNSSITTVPLFDISSATSLQNFFSGCISLLYVPNFVTTNIVNFNSMFSGCSSLISVPVFDTSNATETTNMFNGCSSLTNAPLIDTANVVYMMGMFDGCSSLTSVPAYDISAASDANLMFRDCVSVSSGAYSFYQRLSTQLSNQPDGTHLRVFTNCGSNNTSGRAELNNIPYDNWGGLSRGTNIPIEFVQQTSYSTSSTKGTLYSITAYEDILFHTFSKYANIDFSVLTSFQLLTSAYITSSSTITASKNNMVARQGTFATTNKSCYIYPALVQFSGTVGNSTLAWLLTPSSYVKSLASSTTSASFSSLPSYTHNTSYGTYTTTKTVYFCYIVTNSNTHSANDLTNFGILYFSNYNSEISLLCKTSTVTPSGAIIP